MKKYMVTFKQNGDEYVGYLIVKCDKIKKTGECKFEADNIEVEIDEAIINITEHSEKEAKKNE